jgi:hypothetical protein
MTSDGELLLTRCLLVPTDETARGALADCLSESGDDTLAGIVRGSNGGKYLTMTLDAAQSAGVSPCLKLLWAIAVVLYPEPLARTPSSLTKSRSAGWRALLRTARNIYAEREVVKRA